MCSWPSLSCYCRPAGLAATGWRRLAESPGAASLVGGGLYRPDDRLGRNSLDQQSISGVGVALEQQLLISGLSAGFATLRSVGVVLFMAYASATPVAFFSYVTAATALELLAYRHVVYRTLKPSGRLPRTTDLSALRSVSRLAGAVAFLSIVWISVSQVDRLLLSHFLSLDQFGYFSLAVSVAGSVSLLLVPLGQIVQPRLTILATQERQTEFLGSSVWPPS